MSASVSPYALCQKRHIEVRTTVGTLVVEAWTKGGLAVHKAHAGDWFTITHQPTGLSLGLVGVFAEEEPAVAAMCELAGARNGWILDTPEEVHEFGEYAKRVFAAHGAVERPSPGQGVRIEAVAKVKRLNGWDD